MKSEYILKETGERIWPKRREVGNHLYSDDSYPGEEGVFRVSIDQPWDENSDEMECMLACNLVVLKPEMEYKEREIATKRETINSVDEFMELKEQLLIRKMKNKHLDDKLGEMFARIKELEQALQHAKREAEGVALVDPRVGTFFSRDQSPFIVRKRRISKSGIKIDSGYED